LYFTEFGNAHLGSVFSKSFYITFEPNSCSN
jgi:hypothetical protein